MLSGGQNGRDVMAVAECQQKERKRGQKMKREHSTVRRLKHGNFELRVLIDALNTSRFKSHLNIRKE